MHEYRSGLMLWFRILARAYAKLERFTEAVSAAEQAFNTDAAKKSLFVLFQVVLASGNQNRVSELIDSLQSHEDFECVDLLLVAKEVESSYCNDEPAVMRILDMACELAVQNTTARTAQLPRGILLQNVAARAFQDLKQPTPHSVREGDSSYTVKFAGYAAMLLKASRQHDNAEDFGPPSVFEWFFSMW